MATTFAQWTRENPDPYTYELDPNPNVVTKVIVDQYGKEFIEYRNMPPGTRCHTCRVYPEHHRNAGRRYIKPTSPLKDWQSVPVVVRVYPDGQERTTAFRDFSKALSWFAELHRNL